MKILTKESLVREKMAPTVISQDFHSLTKGTSATQNQMENRQRFGVGGRIGILMCAPLTHEVFPYSFQFQLNKTVPFRRSDRQFTKYLFKILVPLAPFPTSKVMDFLSNLY